MLVCVTVAFDPSALCAPATAQQHLRPGADEQRIGGQLHPPPFIALQVEYWLHVERLSERVRIGEVLGWRIGDLEYAGGVSREELHLVGVDPDRGRVVGPAVIEPR